MNLVNVIEGLVEERGLERDKIVAIVCEGIQTAYEKKYPDITFSVVFNNKANKLEVFAKKMVVASVEDPDTEVSLRKARILMPKAQLEDEVEVPFDEGIGRIEIISARQIIAAKIKELEQRNVYDEFVDKEGMLMTGVAHKRERSGWVVKIGDVMALIPREKKEWDTSLKVGVSVKALLKEVLPIARGDYQLILDRSSTEFIKRLLELEIPEIFEGIIEIKRLERIPGYKTKILVSSTSSDVDPVGTCVGVGGSRIRPVLQELGQEKIDLIGDSDNVVNFIKDSLKPAEIDKVEFIDDETVRVWLAQDQRSVAIGKLGQNIQLASRLTGYSIQLQDLPSAADIEPFYGDSDFEGGKEEGFIETSNEESEESESQK